MKKDLKNKIENIISSNQNADEKELLFQLKQLLYENELEYCIDKDSKSISSIVSKNVKTINSKTQNNNIIKSGFNNFDEKFGGFGLGEFIVIGGRPAMGKTQLLLNLSLNVSKTNPVLYFTFDLSEFHLTNRFISSVSGIPINNILQQQLSDEQKTELLSVESKLSKHKLFINESCYNLLTAFRAHCQKQIEENGVKVIFVDYLQMMSTNQNRFNRALEISDICRELKNIAIDFNVCVIAASQLSRAVETRGGERRPILSDLRESGAIEQDADKVIFIYRPEYYGIICDEENNMTTCLIEIILAKNKNGSPGSIKLLRDENFTNFTCLNEDIIFEKKLEEMTTKNPNIKTLIDRLSLINTNY